MIRRPYPPGKKGKRRPRPLSEYGKELREKQKLKNWYNLQEKQFANYVKKILAKKKKAEDPTAILIKSLENRLDNVIFRLGFAVSREQAKQFVSHGHFLVNGKSIDTPAYSVRKGDVIAVKPHKAKKTVFQNIKTILKKQKPPSWLELSIEKLEGKVIEEPSLEEAAPPVEVSAIFEYYSR